MRIFIDRNPHETATQMELNEIIARYQEPIYWHIRRLVVSHEEARDLTQDTFVQVIGSIDSLRDQGALRSWIYRIATNLSYRHLSRKRELTHPDKELSEWLLTRLESATYVDYEDRGSLLFQQALLSLNEHRRTVFTLRYYDELSYDEIATITDSSSGALRVAYHEAKEQITRYLNEHL